MAAAMVNASASPRFRLELPSCNFTCSNNSNTLLFPKFPTVPSKKPQPLSSSFSATRKGPKNINPKNIRGVVCLAVDNNNEQISNVEEFDHVDKGDDLMGLERETALHSVSPFPLLLLAALLPGAANVRSLFGPFVELVKSWDLPDWLVHWGHPFNMAVVLFAMGGYGTYLGFRIRASDDLEEKVKAKDLHPKLMAGMFFFFSLGATGGITSLLTSDKPIFESPHAVTGVIGLALLTVQTILPALFEGNPGLRNVHGILGSGIMTLFLVHAALGLQLGLSY